MAALQLRAESGLLRVGWGLPFDEGGERPSRGKRLALCPVGSGEGVGRERLERQTLLQGTAGVIGASWMARALSQLPQPLVLSPGESKAWEPCKVRRFGSGRCRDSDGVEEESA